MAPGAPVPKGVPRRQCALCGRWPTSSSRRKVPKALSHLAMPDRGDLWCYNGFCRSRGEVRGRKRDTAGSVATRTRQKWMTGAPKKSTIVGRYGIARMHRLLGDQIRRICNAHCTVCAPIARSSWYLHTLLLCPRISKHIQAYPSTSNQLYLYPT